jgi:hypothetical protein
MMRRVFHVKVDSLAGQIGNVGSPDQTAESQRVEQLELPPSLFGN